jgi:hypothetical protein
VFVVMTVGSRLLKVGQAQVGPVQSLHHMSSGARNGSISQHTLFDGTEALAILQCSAKAAVKLADGMDSAAGNKPKSSTSSSTCIIGDYSGTP